MLADAARRGLVREGLHGTTWFLHQVSGQPVGWEMRGPEYKGFVAGGSKTGVVLAESEAPARVIVCESAIDALSLAMLDGLDDATAYVSTGGGWGDGGRPAITGLVRGTAVLIAATDRGIAGEKLAERLEHLARERTAAGVRRLRDLAEVAGFLESTDAFPLFAKPIDGKYSLDVFSIDGRDRATGQLLLRGSEPVAARELAACIATHEAGYLFQRRLAPHPAISEAFGDRLCSVRLIVLLTADGPRVHRAVAKVPVGDNPADNYWRPGNLIGAVDLDTGEIRRAVRGSGAELAVNPSHPDTGAEIAGVRLPNWARTLDLARAAAALLPGIRTQSWDIALAEEPTLLEVNFGGDLNLAQLGSGQAFLTRPTVPIWRAAATGRSGSADLEIIRSCRRDLL